MIDSRHHYSPKQDLQKLNLLSEQGFTIIELLLVMAMLGILSTLAMAAYGEIKAKVYTTRAIEELRGIEKLIAGYTVETGGLPAKLSQLNQGQLLDPWKRPYVYVRLSDGGPPRKDTAVMSINTEYDLYSMGSDGVSAQLLSDAKSKDDILRGADGAFVGAAESY